jgi:hypothetical protein
MVWEIGFKSNFFDSSIPLLRRKQSAFALQAHPGLWQIHLQLGQTTVLSTFYTRIDQACLLWGVITVLIFAIAQFTSIDWSVQALVGTGLTIAGTIGMLKLANYCIPVKPLARVIRAWAVLMLAGMLCTDLGIFLAWSWMLQQLCLLWLSVSALGYLYSGLELRSRSFFLVCLLHLVGIVALPYVQAWQFLFTGCVIGLSAIGLAELQWDSSGVCVVHVQANES